jgi:hypothetical protein
MAGNNKRQEYATDIDGSNKEGEGGKGKAMVTAMRVASNKEGKGGMGHGVGAEGGVRQRGQWR